MVQRGASKFKKIAWDWKEGKKGRKKEKKEEREKERKKEKKQEGMKGKKTVAFSISSLTKRETRSCVVYFVPRLQAYGWQ